MHPCLYFCVSLCCGLKLDQGLLQVCPKHKQTLCKPVVRLYLITITYTEGFFFCVYDKYLLLYLILINFGNVVLSNWNLCGGKMWCKKEIL